MAVVLSCTMENRKVSIQGPASANSAQHITLNHGVRQLGAYHNCSTECKLDIQSKTVLQSKTILDVGSFFSQGRAERYPPRMA